MNKAYWIVLPLLMSASAAFPQTIMEKLAAEGGIIESTDPEIVAEVERKAADIVAAHERRQQRSHGASGTAGTGASGAEQRKHQADKKQGKADKEMHKEGEMHKDGGSYQETPAAPK